MRVVGGRWVPWWIVLVGRKRDGDGGGWEGVARRRVERFGVGMVDWLGSLAEGGGFVCGDWVRGFAFALPSAMGVCGWGRGIEALLHSAIGEAQRRPST